MTPFTNLAAILLAAGFSRRMGGENKLLKPLDGKPLIAHAVATVAGLGLGQLIIVLGDAADALAPLLPAAATPSITREKWLPVFAGDAETKSLSRSFVGLPTQTCLVRNSRAAEGMGASLAAGAAALDPSLAGVFVVLSDMPFVTRGDYDALAAGFAAQGGGAICVPLHDGRRGHPVLFPARHFSGLAASHGDSGARRLLADPDAVIREVEGCSAGVLADFDDPAAFAAHFEGRGKIEQ